MLLFNVINEIYTSEKKLLEHQYYKIKQVLKLLLKITKPVGVMEKGTRVRLLENFFDMT